MANEKNTPDDDSNNGMVPGSSNARAVRHTEPTVAPVKTPVAASEPDEAPAEKPRRKPAVRKK